MRTILLLLTVFIGLSKTLAGDQPGSAPVLTIIRGDNQRGNPGAFLPVPVVAKLTLFKGSEADITFLVTSGTALLAPTNEDSKRASTSVTTHPGAPTRNEDGSTNFEARAFVYLPAGESTSTIRVIAGRGAETTSANAMVIAEDARSQPPLEFKIDRNTATTVDLSWIPYNLSRPTTVEISRDGGLTWQTAATFEPGIKAGTISQLTPDQPIQLRLRTAAATAN